MKNFHLSKSDLINDEIYHPASENALKWIKKTLQHNVGLVFYLTHSFNRCISKGLRNTEIYSETLRRILKDEYVQDIYILGLAWTMKELIENANKEKLQCTEIMPALC